MQIIRSEARNHVNSKSPLPLREIQDQDEVNYEKDLTTNDYIDNRRNYSKSTSIGAAHSLPKMPHVDRMMSNARRQMLG